MCFFELFHLPSVLSHILSHILYLRSLRLSLHRDLRLPLPFASRARDAFVCSAREYRDVFEGNGFSHLRTSDIWPVAMEGLDDMLPKVLAAAEAARSAEAEAKAAGQTPPPPSLSLGLVMGEDYPTKMCNLRDHFGSKELSVAFMLFEKHAQR